MKKMYETAMINRGGRDGEVEAPNGSMHMKIDRPGIHSEGTNPEQIFCGWIRILLQRRGSTHAGRK